MTDTILQQRRDAAKAAAALIESGMRVGLGTGRTAALFIEALAERVAAESLSLLPAVATSVGSRDAAAQAGLPVAHMDGENAPTHVDIVVDGADEVDGNLHLIKGGGGSLLREKIVAHMGRRMVVIVDAAKRVERLGAFPLPVEIVPFAWPVTAAAVAERCGVTPKLREKDGKPFVTDNHNYIVDCGLGAVEDPQALARGLAELPGVVEHGLFLSEADEALVGTPSGVVRIVRPR